MLKKTTLQGILGGRIKNLVLNESMKKGYPRKTDTREQTIYVQSSKYQNTLGGEWYEKRF